MSIQCQKCQYKCHNPKIHFLQILHLIAIYSISVTTKIIFVQRDSTGQQPNYNQNLNNKISSMGEPFSITDFSLRISILSDHISRQLFTG